MTPATVAAGRRVDGVAFDKDGATLVWLEGRSGQGVLVVLPLALTQSCGCFEKS